MTLSYVCWEGRVTRTDPVDRYSAGMIAINAKCVISKRKRNEGGVTIAYYWGLSYSSANQRKQNKVGYWTTYA